MPVLAQRVQLSQREQGLVDAVLRAHHADVAEQEALAALQRRVGLARHEAGQVGTGTDDGDVVGVAPAALDRDPAVGVVDREHDVGAAEGDLLGGERRLVQQTAAEAGEVELRREVVVVEDEAGAAAAQPERREQEEIGRAAGVDEVEAALAGEPAGEPADAPERGQVLERVAGRALAGAAGLVAVDLDAVDPLVVVPVAALAGRADHGHLVAGPGQRGGLVPDVTVRGDRLVLEQDENAPCTAPPARARLDAIAGQAAQASVARSAPSPIGSPSHRRSRPRAPPAATSGQREPAVLLCRQVLEEFLVHAQSGRGVEVVGVGDQVDQAAVGDDPVALAASRARSCPGAGSPTACGPGPG